MADSPTQSPAQTDNPRNSEPEHDSVGLENPAIEDSVTVSEHSQDSEIIPTEDDVLHFIGGRPGFPRNRDPSTFIVTSDKIVGNKVPEEIQKNPNKTSFASFGDKGTTATVGSAGQILQITKYLPAGRSKFFSVDRWSTPAPHKIQERAEDLMDNATNSYSVGFALDDFEDSELDFVCDRWPRFTRSMGNCVSRMQYFACDGTIFQQFVLEKCHSQDPVEVPSDHDVLSRLIEQVELYDNILIRDLDPQAKDYQFNTSKSYDTEETYFTHLRNERFSLIRTHKSLPSRPSTDASPSTQTVHTDTEFSVELVMTAFINGIPQKFKPPQGFLPYYSIEISAGTATAEFDSSKCLEITVAYKLQLAQPRRLEPWKSWLIPASGLERMRIAYSKPGFRDVNFSQNELFNFKIRRNLEHILSVCSIPITSRDSADHGLETNTTEAESEGFLENIELQDSDDDHREDSEEQHDESHEQAGQEQHNGDDEQEGQEQHNEDHEQQIQEQQDREELDGEGKDNPIALTCGDMSGHLIVSAAGFSAFQFLVAMHKFLQEKLKDPTQCTQFAGCLPCRYRKTTNDTLGSISGLRCTHCMQVEGLARRIRDVCKGHMDLVFKTPRTESGEETPGWSSSRGSSRSVTRETDVLGGNSRPGSFIDGASKLIMAQGFYSISTADSAPKDLPEKSIKDISDSWFAQLERAEKRRERGPYAFARSTDEITNSDNYYLEDHGWIWTTLKGIEKTWRTLIPNPAARNRKQKSSPNGGEGMDDSTPRFYSSKDAQRHILKHFTTENSTIQRRTLAVFRSSSETRFIFRSRDTALFHCMGLKFFNMAESESILDVWRNTLLAQAIHEDNQSNEWVSPLKYTLALVMACNGLQINRSSINEIFKESKEVLLANAGSPWANGLFPGSLNPSTKAPEVFQNATSREAHWTATFEVPYVLWMHAKDALEQGAPNLERKEYKGGQEPQDSHSKEIKTTKEISVTGKRMPFNNLIDQRSITEPPDEWLYNEPDFLTFVPEKGSPDDEDIPEGLRKLEKPAYKFTAPSDKTSSSEASPFTAKLTGVIIDIRRCLKGNNMGGVFVDPLKDISMMNNDTIAQKLRHRGPDLDNDLGIVKKRFAWLPYADSDTAKQCWFATSDSEKENMVSFFERHSAYENFFFDDTTAASNTWNTELQLAFYQLHEENGGSPPGGIPRARQVDFPVEESDGTRKKISRATMGFRFDGDFFDRYWNCHFIEFKPGKRINLFKEQMKPEEDANQDPDIRELISLLQPSMFQRFERGKQPWRQRKVLELILFDRILEEITTSTEDIMHRIRAALKIIRENVLNDSKDYADQESRQESWRKKSPLHANWEILDAASRSRHVEESVQKKDALEDSLQAADFVSKMKGEDYLEFSKQSQAFEQVLRVLDDDLGENIEQIERWKNREQDRAPEQPRWTRNDERRYRTTITKMLASNSQKMRRLDRCRFNIQSLKTSLESTREYIRDDLNLRGAEDVRLFTYVTATFLPISFATGVFSMGDFPGGALLGSMIGLAVFALLLTAVALVHDKHLAIFARLFKDFVLSLHPLHPIKKLLKIGQFSSRKEHTPQAQDMSKVMGKKEEGPKQKTAFSNFRRRPWGKAVPKQGGVEEV